MEIGNEPDIMSVDEAAEYLKVSKGYMFQLLREGKIPGRKLGRAWRIIKADIADALRSLPPNDRKKILG